MPGLPSGSDDSDFLPDAPPDAEHRHGSFFGRRKGHDFRAHRLDLIEQLLPRLTLDDRGRRSVRPH